MMLSSNGKIEKNEEPERDKHETNDHLLQYQKSLLPLRSVNSDYKCPLPTKEAIRECTEATKKTIEKLLGQNAPAALSNTSSSAARLINSNEFSHTVPNVSNDKDTETLVKVIERHKDPLAPSTKKILKKIPLADDNTELLETPILHSENASGQKLDEKEKALLNIPSAVSSWENSKGFSISIDKRLQYTQSDRKNVPKEINNKFVELTKALDATSEKKRIELAEKNERLLKAKEDQEEFEKIKEKIAKTKSLEQKETQRNSRYSQHNQVGRRFGGDNREAIRAQRRREIQHTSRFNNKPKQAPTATLDERDMQTASVSVNDEGENEVQYDSRFFTRAADATWKRSEDQMFDTPLFRQRDETVSSVYKNRRAGKRTERDADNDVVHLKETPVEFVSAGTKDEPRRHNAGDSHFANSNKKRKTNE
ncbi:hypothetical protein ACO0QE_003235 [Hanseniaspora vineae]